jgi:prepilin-type N-terminal cleavage/methylation domain-containing protein
MKGRKLYSKGFTFIEVLLIVAIIGILLVVAYPNIKNSLEVRGLENQAREILTALQQTKFMAVKVKLFHRLRFDNTPGYWVYYIERQTDPNTWVEIPGSIRRAIPAKYTVTVNVLNDVVVFSPIGTVTNYDITRHNISLQSEVLQQQSQPSTRTIVVYMGGSIQYIKST